MLNLRLLGPVELIGPDGPVDLGGGRPTRLLVALYMADRHRLDLDALVERSFDDDDRPDDAIPAIRTAVRRLRRALGDDAVLTQQGGYELQTTQIDTDLDRFDELIAAGRASNDPVAAITSFRRALDLWHGTPFGELGELDWLVAERVRLEASHLMAMEGWHDAHLRNGTATEIIPSLESATAEHPLRERFHRQLMQALFVADRQADALRAFQTYRQTMVDAGLEPGPEAVALEQRIATGDSTLRAASQGRPLRGYRIAERLGEGAFSIVYRGTQPSVERDVAIKQIRAELANRPDFIRRFEAEAHMVAHLEHPFIVPLYDYWREPGSAYLVMRLLTGGSLESSLLDGPWDLDRTSQMVEQVGAALSAAHRTGVVHRDVKSANILLDDEGNSYLTDFGIALTESEMFDPGASLSAGSPAYASPEQLRREPVGPSADVHGLAIAVYEALTGRLPFPDEPTQAALLQRQLHDPIPTVRSSRTDVPVAVDEVLQRATAKTADERYQSIEDFVAAYEAAASSTPTQPRRGTATVVPTEQRNPYKGLRAFTEADAGDFAGRDRLVDQLIGAFADNRILAVVGPSGSGKSSAVRAGLLPALRRGAVPGSADWFVTTLFPGANPDEELEAALLQVASTHPPGLLDVLRDGDRGINRALRQVLPPDGQLLLVIDQFEELFTLCDDELQRRRFLDGLAAAVTEERSRLRVILTLRADFYDRPLRYESIGRLVRDATVPVLPLAADELEQAIAEPALSVGAEFAPGLISEIVADVSDQPGALPLMQYALTELYERRVSNLITRDAYEAIGRVTGALAARAEQLYETSSPDERDAMRRLFGRLVTLGEGTEDTRRRVMRRELGSSATVERVIDRFGRARLLSFDRDPSSREPTVEVAHEALLREWPRLRSWLDDDRDGLRIHRHLTDTSSAWVASGRDTGELYRGGRLDGASTWATDHGDDLNDTEREFLGASVSQRTAEEAAEREHLDQQLRSNRRLRVLVAVASVIAVIAAVAGVFALQQRSRADDEATEARAQADQAEQARREGDFERLLALARTADPADPTVGLLLAIEAEALLDEGSVQFTAEREIAVSDALHRALTARVARVGALQTGAIGADLTVLDDGRRIVVHTADSVQLWDAAANELLEAWQLGSAGARSAFEVHSAAAADASVIVVAGPRATMVIEPDTGLPPRTVAHSVAPTIVRLAPNSSRLVIGFVDGTVEVRDLDSLEVTATESWEQTISNLAWHPNGRHLAVGTYASTVAVWSPDTDEVIWQHGDVAQPTFTNAAHGLLFNADGTQLVVSTQDLVEAAGSNRRTGERRIHVLDAATGADTVTVTPFAEEVPGLIYRWADATETAVLVAPAVGAITRLDLLTGVVTEIGAKPTTSPAFGVLPELGLLATPSGATVELRDLDGSGALARFVPLAGEQRPAEGEFLVGAFGAEGTKFVVSSVGTPVVPHVTDLTVTPADPVAFVGPADSAPPVIVDGSGEFTVHVSVDTSEPDDPVLLHTFRRGLDGPAIGPAIAAPLGIMRGLGMSPRGDRVALVLGDDVVLYDVETGSEVAVLEGLPLPEADIGFAAASFSPDGEYLHTMNLFATARYDADDGRLIWATEEFGFSYPGPGTEWMVTPNATGLLQVRDPVTREVIRRPLVGHTGEVIFGDVAFDGGRILTTSRDGTARVWDIESGLQLGRELPTTQSSTRSWSADGSLLAVPQSDGYMIWNQDTSTWADIACQVAGRNLTQEEWDEFGPRTIGYRETCD